MPYVLLVLGLLIGFYAFSRYFVNASPEEIKILIRNASIAVVAMAILFLAITGRLAAGLVVLVVMLPLWLRIFRQMRGAPAKGPAPKAASMTETEALEILDLKPGADPEAINAAYKKLMQKVHPDNQGSDWMAAKLNQARDRLLKKPSP